MKSTYNIILSLILFCSAFVNAWAELSQRGMIWTGFDIDGPFGDSKWNYNFMNQARMTNNDTVLEQYVMRPSIY